MRKNRKNTINRLTLLLLLAALLAVMTNIALDTCILPHTGDYIHPFCKILAFLSLLFISMIPAIFLVLFLLIIGGMNEKSKK
jgi:uncharacterized membrane protein